MPIYEYKCTECGRSFEALQRINEEPLRRCIHCGGPVEKLISQSSFQLKGAGWYVTDYSKSANRRDKDAHKKTTATGGKQSVTNE